MRERLIDGDVTRAEGYGVDFGQEEGYIFFFNYLKHFIELIDQSQTNVKRYGKSPKYCGYICFKSE